MKARYLELHEFEPALLAHDSLSPAVGRRLWRDYDHRRRQIKVEFPNPATDYQWRLSPLGWAGQIPLTPDLFLAIRPKVPLQNLFRMWEYAYQLNSFHLLEGTAQVRSLVEFYERVAHILAGRVRRRVQRGLYQAYVPHSAERETIRGRFDLRRQLSRPDSIRAHCHYQDFTRDLPDNQILAYTLARVARSRHCRDRIGAEVRRAFHSLSPSVRLRPFFPQDCVGRAYNRLNEDYRPLHGLCRFLLEHAGPDHRAGEHAMVPFLLNMARLYELFVAEWLKTHLPPPWRVMAQENVTVGRSQSLRFQIDLVIYDERNEPRFVLDTKYKMPERTSHPDFNQIVTYAKARGCDQAILIYPTPLPEPLKVEIDGLQVRSLAFRLDGDLDQAGQHFVDALLAAG